MPANSKVGSLIAVAAAALLVLAAPAGASCRASKSKGAKVLAQSREAVVFSKDKTYPPLRRQAIRFGCVFSVGTPHRLTWATDFDNSFTNLQLAGRYAAFSWDVEDAADSTANHTIYLYDLRTGKIAHRVGDVAPGDTQGANGSTLVYAIVLKRNASIAWLASFERKVGEEQLPGGATREIWETVYQVNKVEHDLGNQRTMADEGTDIESGSLALSDNRRTISWIRGGTARSAPLR